MAGSILTDTKKVLGFEQADDGFDLDIIMHINSAFATLNQLGIGPADGFEITDDSATWDEFLADDKKLNSVKSYLYLRVRLIFDPPTTSFHLQAMKEQIEQIEWRLNVKREEETWVEPTPTSDVEPEVIIVPSDQAWYSEP